MLNIADAAVEQLVGITGRLAELAAQAATGTYTKAQRAAANAEAQALAQEFFRISRSAYQTIKRTAFWT